MSTRQHEPVVCQICKKEKPGTQVLPAALVRESIVETIRKEHPDWSPAGYICLDDLNHYRNEHIEEVLEAEKGELTDLEEDVVHSLQDQDILSENVNTEFEERLTVGERVADAVAQFGGSWRFIIIFWLFLAGWMLVNTVILLRRPFDPYPFILLNLVLSCLAAIQAPIIMMSQNRQEAKDRLRSEHDYRVNLKAELEIRLLHQKMDQLLKHQWQRLLEIQQIQMDTIQQLAAHRPARGAT